MVKFSLFGAGTIGTVHARNIAQHPRSQIQWIVDQDEPRAKALAELYGGKTSASVDKVLSEGDFDAVIIASSTSVHQQHLLATIAARKAVLCEKPIADSLADARTCVEAAKAAGIVAAIGFNRRFDPHHRAVHDRTRHGDIGRVELLHIVSRSPEAPKPETVRHSGGMIREKGTHFFDLAYWMAASEPVEAFASGSCLIDPDFARYHDVDTAALTLRFETGALATFSFSRRTGYGYDELIEVFGSDGMLESRRQQQLGVSLYQGRKVISDGLHAGWYDRFAPTYGLELDSFVSAVESKTPVHATLTDGLRAQAVAEAMIQSIDSHRPVAIERVW